MVFRCTNPVHTNRINQEMNRLFSTFLGETPQHSTASGSVAANVWEKDEAWLLEMELPGVAPSQLDISVVNDELTISVERPEVQEEGVTCFRCERPQESFSRTIQLPTTVDAEKVEAALLHGVLTIRLPKSEAARRRKIQVNAEN